MTITDEQLGAFLDGECSAAEAARIADLLANDAVLAARFEQLSTDTLMLRGAFAGVLDETVPAALLKATKALEPVPVSERGKIIDFAAARAAHTPRWMPPLAIAASIALGVVVGAVGFNGPAGVNTGGDDRGLILAASNGPVAGPALAVALASARSGTTTSLAAAAVKPVLTFRDDSGRLCRQFSLQQQDVSTSGIACQESGAWRLVVIATSDEPANGNYVTAAGPSDAAVAETLDSMIAGEPFDAEAEAEALAPAK